MILVFTGNGKGKTTAAIGQCVRALGRGKRVAFIQFIKSADFPSGEDSVLATFGDKVLYHKGGLGFVGILGDKLPIKEHQKAAAKTLKKAASIIGEKQYELVVLDEINVALKLGLIKLINVLKLVNQLPKDTDLILTGRDAPMELIRKADLATEFREIKHPFRKKVLAKKGIEY